MRRLSLDRCARRWIWRRLGCHHLPGGQVVAGWCGRALRTGSSHRPMARSPSALSRSTPTRCAHRLGTVVANRALGRCSSRTHAHAPMPASESACAARHSEEVSDVLPRQRCFATEPSAGRQTDLFSKPVFGLSQFHVSFAEGQHAGSDLCIRPRTIAGAEDQYLALPSAFQGRAQAQAKRERALIRSVSGRSVLRPPRSGMQMRRSYRIMMGRCRVS